jgi:inner membrane protein
MDSLTHLALGACMGELFAGKTLGKKAMIWGALAQSVPDIDFVAALWSDIPSGLLAHRGFTHSFLFLILICPLMAFAAEWFHRPHNIRLQKWLVFFFAVAGIHIFIDAFNNYGIGWLEPFSHKRISFNAIYVADPFFSLWPFLSCTALLLLKPWNRKRKYWVRVGLGMSSLYLVYCLYNKAKINNSVQGILKKQHISYSRYFSTPAPLQNWLWYVVAGNDSGYFVGFRSLFDTQDTISFHFFPRQDSLLKNIGNPESLNKLIRFSGQFYTIEKWHDTLVFNDLRFGQITGWQDPQNKFVFHYFLLQPGENNLVVQRGRFENWNRETFISLLNRIKGN